MKVRKRWKSVLGIALLFVFAFTSSYLIASAATASIIQTWPYDLVDSGKHLDWDADQSKYESYIATAASKWNAYKAGVLRPDSLLVIQDVRVSDANKSGETWTGETNILFGYIHMNIPALDSLPSNNNRLNTAIHELGHALGLAHNDGTTTNIMYSYNTAVTTLSANDKASYDAAYARY
jgi:hypothetical protein